MCQPPPTYQQVNRNPLYTHNVLYVVSYFQPFASTFAVYYYTHYSLALTLKTFSAMPTRVMKICVKFQISLLSSKSRHAQQVLTDNARPAGGGIKQKLTGRYRISIVGRSINPAAAAAAAGGGNVDVVAALCVQITFGVSSRNVRLCRRGSGTHCCRCRCSWWCRRCRVVRLDVFQSKSTLSVVDDRSFNSIGNRIL